MKRLILLCVGAIGLIFVTITPAAAVPTNFTFDLIESISMTTVGMGAAVIETDQLVLGEGLFRPGTPDMRLISFTATIGMETWTGLDEADPFFFPFIRIANDELIGMEFVGFRGLTVMEIRFGPVFIGWARFEDGTATGRGSVSVTGSHAAPVPEPASILLFGGGLLGLAGYRWQQRRREGTQLG